MPNKINIHLVRHVPVENPEGIWYGREVFFDTESETVKTYFKLLAQNLPHNPDTTLWVSSPYKRALETAQGVRESLAAESRKPEIHLDNGFVEQQYGVMEGLSRQQVADCKGAAGYLADLWETPPEGGGESMQMLQNRVAKSLNGLVDGALERGMDNIVVFTHGGVMMAAFAEASDRRMIDIFHERKVGLTPSFSYISCLELSCRAENGQRKWGTEDYIRGIPKKEL